MNYRIKTREEFINEYGTDFGSIVQYGWVDCMDFLFGKKLNQAQINDLTHLGDTHVAGWHISNDMVTREPLSPEAINPSFNRKTKEWRGNIHLDYTITGNTLQVSMDGTTVTAKCHPDDKFDFNIGMAVALTRLARQLGEYEKEEEVVAKKTVKHNIVDEI